MSQMEPEPLPKDDMSSEIRMQSTTEPGRRNRSRIPLDVKFENLEALFDNVDDSVFTASATSDEPYDQDIADLLHDSRVELLMWSKNIHLLMPPADPPLDILRILGRLDGPLAATLLSILDEIEEDLRELSADATDKKLAFSEQFEATCGRVRASIDHLFELQLPLYEELTNRQGDVRNIISEVCDPAKNRLPLICFDGGGVCSYSGLLILETLMDEVRSVLRESEGDAFAESVQPEVVFRYMFGASTGGWIAIMLGRLKMTNEQCKETFRTYTETIFRRSRWLYHVFGCLTESTTSKYSGKRLARATQDVIESFDPQPESEKLSMSNRFAAAPGLCRCRVGVVTFVEPFCTTDYFVPHVFRAYNNTSPGARNPGKADKCDIWDVALAATAAPRYFPAVEIDGKEYSDGGFGFNNPSYEACHELLQLHPDNPICLVSIGPGTNTAKSRFRSLGRADRRWDIREGRRVNGTKSVDRLMSHLAYQYEEPSYFRFNVPGLEHVPFDEWTIKSRKERPEAGKMHTLEFIEKQTTQYLAGDGTRKRIRACAQMLADCYCPMYESTKFSPVGESHPTST